MTEQTLNSLSFQEVSEGLGQLEAYTDAKEGVAFEMDNKQIWVSKGKEYDMPIHGLMEKSEASKFTVTLLPSGKVVLRDWKDAYVAPIPPDADPNIYPLRPAPDLSPEDASLQFEVFYIENKVAFRAYNGLFLARVDRGYHAVEAAKQVADESCYFRPMIGDICIPTFQILEVTSKDSANAIYYPCVLKRERITNWSNKPKFHTFSLSWEAVLTDKVAWKRLWGLGIAISHTVRINGMSATLKYTADNEKVVSVSRIINKRHSRHVVIPPYTVCIASLLVKINDRAVFTFDAVVRKEICEGGVKILHEPGSWAGVAYHGICLVIEMEPIREKCNIV